MTAQEYLQKSEKQLDLVSTVEEELYDVIEKLHNLLDNNKVIISAKKIYDEINNKPDYEEVLPIDDIPDDLLDEIDNVEYDIRSSALNLEDCLDSVERAKDALWGRL